MFWDKKIHEAVLAHEKAIDLGPDFYLVQRKRHASLTIFLENKDSKVTVHAVFRHSFSVEEAEKMLRKQTLLKNEFARLELPYKIQAELGTGDGSISIELAPKVFAEDQDSAIEAYCGMFVTAVALIHTAELYGGSEG